MSRGLLRILEAKKEKRSPPPLLVELFGPPPTDHPVAYEWYPFSYLISKNETTQEYGVANMIQEETLVRLRHVAAATADALDPESVEPLTFTRLLQVLQQLAAGPLARIPGAARVKELSELVAYDVIGMSRVLALAKDRFVTEFYVDSDSSPAYLDHSRVGRCNTSILFTERERKALETHLDTFRGYTLDYATPSLKNDLEVSGARLRVSLDLDPISVNRFLLDVRRLNITSLTLPQLVEMNVLSDEAASFLVSWLELGGNVTIIGETGTGKTTLLNALDEQLNPNLRRIYIEDAVETKDLLDRGYHQVKIKVDPFERTGGYLHTKETEIVKVLHRSPDLVILSEIQSEEHSRAFYHALASGVRGIQTFHASSLEQAVRRWVNVHGIAKQNLLDLGVLVQMSRPDRLKPLRVCSRVCEMVSEVDEPRLRELYIRDRSFELRRVVPWERVSPPQGRTSEELLERVVETTAAMSGRQMTAR
ncbi:MAG: Flp pilus assembly complex ATPase component TadA [Nitrososphaerales archaeon]|nr:Flp pilus assembly complex ATPase component TadA [Nitrososphaerales archaeon]